MSYGQVPSAPPVCERLKLERERLQFGQAAVAGTAEVTVKTVGRWEREIPIPSDKLGLLARLGFDAQYVVTGERCSGSLSADENDLLSRFRAAPLAVKAAALAGLAAGAEPPAKGPKQVFHGNVGQASDGSITNESGVSFNFGVGKNKE
ncbi:XRE family transcriptional regulator [Pseudomonas sp. o96-267]|nr:XRE family transcriptional regulator [Pseudomonas sp. o96-267]